MSWSIQYIGTADKLVDALNKYSEVVTGASKEEYDIALPHLLGLVNQNYSQEGTTQPMLRVTASGHGHNGYRNCIANVEAIYGVLV